MLLFLSVKVMYRYYGIKKMHMRTAEDCVFLDVKVTNHYYGIQEGYYACAQQKIVYFLMLGLHVIIVV
jgi:uncharacterized membrane protein YozB (DUF420 family)